MILPLDFPPTTLPTQIPDHRLKLNKGMMMFGRLIGIWISQKISPAMYASVDMIICTVVISLMAIPTIAGNSLTYAVTAIYGLAMSTVYGSGVSLTASYMNVSGMNPIWPASGSVQKWMAKVGGRSKGSSDKAITVYFRFIYVDIFLFCSASPNVQSSALLLSYGI